MAKLPIIVLCLTLWITWSEARGFPHAPRDGSHHGKSARNVASEIRRVFAREPKDIVQQFLRTLTKKDIDDEQQQQQQQQVADDPTECPCKQIAKKLKRSDELLRGMWDDTIVPFTDALNIPVDNIPLFPGDIGPVACAIINAKSAEELATAIGVPPEHKGSVINSIEGFLEGFKMIRKQVPQVVNTEFITSTLRGTVNMMEAWVHALRAKGVKDPGPNTPIIPTLKNYYTAAELQQQVDDVLDAYWDDVSPVYAFVMGYHYIDLTQPGPVVSADEIKKQTGILVNAFIEADTLDDAMNTLQIPPEMGPSFDAVVRFEVTLPDEAFEFARLLIDVLELTLDNMVLLQ